MEKTDIAYLAGIIDADGCIGIQKYSNCNVYRVILTVVQRDMPIIEYLYSIFGGSANIVKGSVANKRFYFRWVVTDKKAMEVLEQCKPYLKLKKAQAILATKLFTMKVEHHKKNGSVYTLTQTEAQKEIFLMNKSLNSPATTERVGSKEMQQSELTQMKNRQSGIRSGITA